jgi:hypothetical protein
MALERKYVVFKAEDWDAFCAGMGEGGVHTQGDRGIYITELSDREVDDAHVFRDQDQFTPTVLYAYAHALRNAVEVMAVWQLDIGIDKMANLQRMADDFMDAADKAEKATNRKLPD